MRVSPDRQAEETGEQCVRPAAYNDAGTCKQRSIRLGNKPVRPSGAPVSLPWPVSSPA